MFSSFEEEYLAALDYAATIHKGTKRGDGSPYIFHPIRVSQIVQTVKLPREFEEMRPKMVIVGLLHDCIEDVDPHGEETPERAREIVASSIETNFGGVVLKLVQELTHDMSLPKDERRVKMVENCGAKSQHAQIIKLSDRLDNISYMQNMSDRFIIRYMKETPVMLQKMAGACPELEHRIEQIVKYYEALGFTADGKS